MNPSKTVIAKYFGYSSTTFQKWREVKDEKQKAKLEARFEALKAYYIAHQEKQNLGIIT